MELQNYIDNQTPQQVKSFEILSKNETLQSFLIRIDKNPPKAFVPLMPVKAMEGEDRTIPRISLASTINDCLNGYAVYYNDIIYGKLHKYDTFKNGYIISKLNFDCCVIPKKKLLPDVKDTKEHWIVGYNKDHISFKQETIGKIVFKEMVTTSTSAQKKNNDIKITWCVEVLNEEGLYFTDKLFLNKGWHEVTVDYQTDIMTHTELSRSDFDKVKKLSAALLSLESKPVYTKW
jgi:hypothetical protein